MRTIVIDSVSKAETFDNLQISLLDGYQADIAKHVRRTGKFIDKYILKYGGIGINTILQLLGYERMFINRFEAENSDAKKPINSRDGYVKLKYDGPKDTLTIMVIKKD